MFRKRRTYTDYSARLRSEIHLWNITPQPFRIEPVADACTICVEAAAQLFAVGTSHGEIRVYDSQFKETILRTPGGTPVKLLQFARPRKLFKLLCIDSKHTLHIWNLDVHGNPSLQTSQPLSSPIFRISTCLSHSHALLATQSGDVVAYDLASMEMSPYKIPFAMDGREVSPAVDVLILPKKLNHVIIGYSDGAILYDLLLRKVISCHLIPSSNAINPPSLTVLALHPVGQHYAAGYDDGTIRVWDIYSSKILWAGTTTESLECMRRNRHRQEPIFKMEWVLVLNQDGSSTSWLNVLGGLARPDSTCGLSALGFDTTYLHPTHLESLGYMHDSYLYPTSSLVQDFAIFSDNVPSAGRLFLLSGDDKKTLSLGAFIFPPPPNVPIGQTPHEEKVVELEFSAELEESKEVSRNLTATLEDFRSDQGQATAHRTPLRTPMPLTLNMGASRVLASELISLDSAEYLRLSKQQSEDATFEGQFRIMITQHEDASIRFYDASTLPGVNLSLHPRALDHLTIHVTEIPEIALRPDIHSLRIARVVVAKESLECAVQLTTGEVVMLGLGIRPRTQDELDDEIVDLSDVRDRGDIFVPRFMLQAQPGSPNTIGLSDIGFLAVAYQHGLLVVLDLRGPKIILRDFQNETAKHTEADMVVSLSWVISGVGDDNSLAPRLLSLQKDGSLIIYTLIRPNEAWIVDKSHTIRHNHLSPHPPIFAAVFDARDGIDCRATPTRFANAIGPHADTKTNATHCFWVAANRREIRTNLNITGDKVSRVNLSSQDALQYISLITAHDSSVIVAFVHERVIVYSLPMLEAIHTFPLPAPPDPRLSISCTPAADVLQTYRSLRGDLVIVFTSLLANIWHAGSGTVNFRLHKYAKPMSVETEDNRSPSDTTQTWGASITSWIKSFAEETITGDEIDQILTEHEVEISETPKKQGSSRAASLSRNSGDNRRKPNVTGHEVTEISETTKKQGSRAASLSRNSGDSRRKPNVTGHEVAEISETPKKQGSSSRAASLSRNSGDSRRKPNENLATLGGWGQDIYQQLTSAVNERGERLGELQEQFQQLEAGSKDLVTQAKRLAEKQAAKRWFL